MPYKSKSINFGQEKEFLDRRELNEEIENITLALNLTHQVIGVKLINSKKEYDSLDIPECKGKMSYCQMIAAAGRGRIQKSSLPHHTCDGGTTALGLESSNPKIECGDEYFSYNLYETKAAARRMRASIKSFPSDQMGTYGVLTGPAQQFNVIPDLIIMIVNPYQTMRLIQGFEYRTGIKPQVDMGAMQALCSELTCVPLISGSMNVSVFCPSTRMLCKWGDDEMSVSIPFEHFYCTVSGVFGTMNTTDNKSKKEGIRDRFLAAGKEINVDPSIGY